MGENDWMLLKKTRREQTILICRRKRPTQHHLGLSLLITRQAVLLVKRKGGEKALHAGTVSEQVQKLQHRRKRKVPLIIFTEKGNGMDRTSASLKLEASELQVRTRTTVQDWTKESIWLSSPPSATSNAQDRGTGLG